VTRAWRLVLPILLWTVWAPAASAAFRPSFSLDDCGWNATHVVIVTEGSKIDGVVDVLESWKGNLRKGDQLTLPGLAEFANLTRRAISDPFGHVDPKRPNHVTGARMVLFLKWKVEGADPSKGTWEPACSVWKSMMTSVVWIEKKEVYAFAQFKNPGPSLLSAQGITEARMKDRVLLFVKTQNDLARAIALPRPRKRAEALRPYVSSDLWYARREAFETLGACGAEALPVLRKMLEDNSLSRQHSYLVRALVKAGGVGVGPELTRLVGQELAFWKKTGPNLQVGWWNGAGLKGDEVERLRDRYGVVLEALYGLQETRVADSRQVVTAFRDFWRSLPQLEDRSGLNQMSEACDRVLEKLMN